MNHKMLHKKHSVSLLTDHLVFCPKYRRRVLVGHVGTQAERIIRRICESLGVEIIRMAVNPEHVHIFFKYPPGLSVSYIANRIKGASSRRLRQQFPFLIDFCAGSLWAPSCFHGSVGHGWEVVENYFVTGAV
jgi:putative transposase